jgi:ABC-2 type transport system ATP-binding protein
VNPILEIINIEKQYLGCRALQGVNMTILPNEITGLLGPNASGKTTLLKTIAGLLQPTAGTIKRQANGSPGNFSSDNTSPVNHDIQPGPEARKLISYCPDTLRFPNWMKVCDAFTFYRDMYPDYTQERADKLIHLLELGSIQRTPIKSLSKGMQERLALAVTLARKTNLYLLDEPLDGIDPVGKTRVIDAIISMQPEGASTLISTHLVKDIERILTRVFFLSKGKVVFSGECDTIREERNQTVEQAYSEVFENESNF